MVEVDEKPNFLFGCRELGMNNRSRSGNEGAKMLLTSSSSPEKEEYYRYYTTRGSVGGLDESSSKILMEQQLPLHLQEDYYNNNRISNYSSSSSAKVVWPRLFIALSSKEKEEDFMAMKGCKPPQRPKKRAKLIQKSLLVSSSSSITSPFRSFFPLSEILRLAFKEMSMLSMYNLVIIQTVLVMHYETFYL